MSIDEDRGSLTAQIGATRPNTPNERARARRAVQRHAHNDADRLELLRALGLDEKGPSDAV